MANVVNKNLGYLGSEYQIRLVNAFVNEPNFFRDMYSAIDQNMFTDAYLRGIVCIMKDYFRDREVVPSFKMIRIKANERATSDEDRQYYQETIDKIIEIGTEGIDEILDMAEKFLRQQTLIRISNEIIKLTRDGDVNNYDKCEKLFEEWATLRRKSDDVSSPFQSIDSDLSEEDIVTIPTGIQQLDNILGGGLAKGKLGLIIGGSGFGKTSMTTGLAANAAVNGFKVLQIVFEDTHRDLHRKYMSRVSQVETCDLNKSPEITEAVRAIIKQSDEARLINENVRIERLETGEKTASDIKELIRKKVNEGFKPDLVIVDYFECILAERGTSSDSEHVKEGKTMRKFESMAAQLDVAMWIPTQGNRDSFTAEIVTSDKVGGSVKKVQIAHVVISITRDANDPSNMKATLAILKNRGGRAGTRLNGVTMNNGTCTITCDECVDFDNFGDYNNNVKQSEENIMDSYKHLIRRASVEETENGNFKLKTESPFTGVDPEL